MKYILHKKVKILVKSSDEINVLFRDFLYRFNDSKTVNILIKLWSIQFEYNIEKTRYLKFSPKDKEINFLLSEGIIMEYNVNIGDESKEILPLLYHQNNKQPTLDELRDKYIELGGNLNFKNLPSNKPERLKRFSCRKFKPGKQIDIAIVCEIIKEVYYPKYASIIDIGGHELRAIHCLVPSAGGFYPLEFLILQGMKGYHFSSHKGFSELALTGIDVKALYANTIHKIIEDSSVNIIIFTDLKYSGFKYGPRSILYSSFEAGSVYQEITNKLDEVGINSIILGGILEESIIQTFSLIFKSESIFPLLGIALGYEN